MTEPLPIYTIGHSHHEPDDFAALLRQYQISLLVDIRTTPYSRWAPQFNQPLLRQLLRKLGIRYSHAGETLGGGPPDPTIYPRKPADYRTAPPPRMGAAGSRSHPAARLVPRRDRTFAGADRG